MKKLLLALSVSAMLIAPAAHAESNPSNSSVASVFFGTSVVAAGVMAVVFSPALSVIAVANHSSDHNRVVVKVKDANGMTADLPISAQAATRAGLKPGDTLTSTPRKSGVMLSKDGKPVTFVVPAENADLSKSSELKR